MQSLIIRKGFTKRAAEEDGPSFEQQFGILTNAVIADKFPSMDSMKLAFQLIEKTDDNSEACGAAVYLVGKNVVFVPAFFKNNKLRTGDMMFIAQTQQFLPLADPWLAWLKNKDLNEVGEMVPPEVTDSSNSSKGTTIRDIADPIIKTASVFLRGLLHTEPDMSKRTEAGILDTALLMGKNATGALLDNLIKNNDFLNSTLTFYTGNELDAFAKKASALGEEVSSVELIMPLDKEAKSLSEHELKALYKDGFFIRKIAADGSKAPDVIKSKQLSGMFSAVSEPGKVQLLQRDGNFKECLVLRRTDIEFGSDEDCCCYEDGCYIGTRKKADPGMTAAQYTRSTSKSKLVVVSDDDDVTTLVTGAMALTSGKESFKKDMLDSIGEKISSSLKQLPDETWFLFPDGSAGKLYAWGFVKTDDNQGWTSGNKTISIATDDQKDLMKPMKSGSVLILPQDTRVILPWEYNSDGSIKEFASEEARRAARDNANSKTNAPVACVTLGTLDAFLTVYCKKTYNKARIYHNGSEYIISGDKSEDPQPKGIKEAALELVQNYDVDPAIAKVMLKDACNGATYDNPKSSLYYITKTAEEITPTWHDANIPMSEAINKPPRIERQELPTILEDPAQLQQAITNAAQAGIKEVFDITALKLLIRQNHFFDEIHDDIPLFMQALDSLCRKLFQFYWHTDKMEEKYGMVKLKALEESLKCTIDSLSELTIFFKLRTVDGSGITGDTTGELMSGQML